MMDNIHCVELCLTNPQLTEKYFKEKLPLLYIEQQANKMNGNTSSIEHIIRKMSVSERKVLVDANPVAQAIAFDQIVTTVFNVLFKISLIGTNTRRGSKNWKMIHDRPWGIMGRVNAAFASVEAQRLQGLHVHGLLFGGFITPERLGEIAHDADATASLLKRLPDISSVLMSETVKQSIPSQPILKSDGTPSKRPAVDPRVGMTPPVNMESFHFFEPGLEEFHQVLKGKDSQFPNWIRRTNDGTYEILTEVKNLEKRTYNPEFDGPLHYHKMWVSQAEMLDNFRFFFTISERTQLLVKNHSHVEKQRLLVRTEAARISARGNHHQHRRGCRSKEHRLKTCRYVFMRLPSTENRLKYILQDALDGQP